MRDFSTDARANVNQHAAKNLQWKITNTNAHILHAVNFQISHQCKLPDVNFIGQYTSKNALICTQYWLFSADQFPISIAQIIWNLYNVNRFVFLRSFASANSCALLVLVDGSWARLMNLMPIVKWTVSVKWNALAINVLICCCMFCSDKQMPCIWLISFKLISVVRSVGEVRFQKN